MRKLLLKIPKWFGLLVISFFVVGSLVAQQPVNKIKKGKKQVKQEISIQKQLKINREELFVQQSKIADNLPILNKVAKQQVPANLSKKEKKKWKQQTKWIDSVIERFSAHQKKLKQTLKYSKKWVKKDATEATRTMAQEQMDGMNMEFLALQNNMQMESRKFNTVSNALKARHDIAMNSIRNMK